MMGALDRDLAAHLYVRNASAEVNATAAGAGDNTEVNGSTLSLVSTDMLNQKPASVAFLLWLRAALGAGENLAVETTLQYSVDGGSNWLDATVANGCGFNKANIAHAAVLASVGGGTVLGVLKVGMDLTRIPTSANAVRIQFTPNLSAGATDTATLTAVAAFGGLQNPPEPAAGGDQAVTG